MEVEVEDASDMGVKSVPRAEIEVANDPLGRHEQTGLVPPSGGLDLKPYREREVERRERGVDESSPDHREPQDQDREKGRKRRKQRRARPNKKVWLWRKELAEAAGAGSGRDGANQGGPALPAPNNTTQFIMEDHTDLQDLDLEAQRASRIARSARSRDPSFSIDSEEEFSSSYEEDLYLSKEFANTYEDVHVERLGTMSKVDLIQEYLQLEERVDVLEKKLKQANNTSSGTNDSGGNGGTGTDSDSETVEGEMPLEPAMAEKIRIFKEEIQKLVVENKILAQENQRLQSSSSLVRPSSSSLSSSIDSESDSSTTSGSSSTTSSSGKSRVSRSSKSSRSSSHKNSDLRKAPEDAVSGKNSDVEMTIIESNHEGAINSVDQEMDTVEDQMPRDSSNQDSSVVSSVAAH